MVTSIFLSALVSAFVVGVTQRDGRAFVVESHTDDFGVVHCFEYLSSPGDDRSAIMASRAVSLAIAIKAFELDRILSSDSSENPRYNTAAEFMSAFRERFQSSTGIETAKLARWLLNALDGGRITVAQIRTAFSLTATQWTALQTKLEAMRTALNNVESAKGE